MIITLSFGRLICLLFELFATKNHEFVISEPITTLIFWYIQRIKPTKAIWSLGVCFLSYLPFFEGVRRYTLVLKTAVPGMCCLWYAHGRCYRAQILSFTFHHAFKVRTTHMHIFEREIETEGAWCAIACMW